ncbi:unnamed protein product [Spirodela intermedia]|uniref:NAD-dependent epimerase/dehydratase domain-containing protein n=1 Tax=Spirodela intermedia TaxID=51605 RepID=A0A7I8JG80_SPIIN|nr:unnamed protein product [Spirodela intermedia]CAA6668765.1 unnamed protein product [Spirodela intermedia]
MAKLACVTGCNGFVGSSLVKLLLQRGYRVRATSRNPGHVKAGVHEGTEGAGDLEIFAGDLMVPGSFDQAVASCDYVFHVACPVNLEDEDPENNLRLPAVVGTLNLLTSCAKAGTVKRVVLTSSGAAVSVNRLRESGLVMDETAWSDVDYLKAEKPPTWGYLVGKTEAEMAAWKFAEENKLDLVAVNPVLIVGPSLVPDPPPVSGLLSPTSLIMQTVSGSVSLVHLEDSENASGRYILSPINTGVAELAEFLATRYELPEPKLVLSSAKLVGEGFQFKYGNLEDAYDDLIKYGYAVGLLAPAGVKYSLKTPVAAVKGTLETPVAAVKEILKTPVAAEDA